MRRLRNSATLRLLRAAKVLAAPDVSMDDKDLTGSWFVLPTESEREAVDIGALTGNPGQAGVLIAQLNVSKASPPSCEGSGFEGVVTLFTSSADGGSLEGIEVPFSRVVVVSCVWDCIGDDLVIGLDEFLAVLGLWGFVGSHACDFDGDGFIGIDEFLKVLGLWGFVCCQ